MDRIISNIYKFLKDSISLIEAEEKIQQYRFLLVSSEVIERLPKFRYS